MELIIAEKPNQAADIAAALITSQSLKRGSNAFTGASCVDGHAVEVRYAKGHLLELFSPERYDPKWASWSPDLLPISPPELTFKYSARDPDSQLLLNGIRDACGRASEIVNACDAAREGELIFWEIMRILSQPKDKRVTRLWIQNPTASGILKAYHKRKEADAVEYRRSREAALLRQHADWLYGINLSRYVTNCLRAAPEFRNTTFSIGRVMTPVLGLIYDSTAAARNFKEEPFYRIRLSFRGITESFQALVVAPEGERFGRVDTMFRRSECVDPAAYNISVYAHYWEAFDEVKEADEFAPEPFSLVELQRSCFRIMRWSAARTLEVAQRCYDIDKTITYPRTSSWHLPISSRPAVEQLHRKLWVEYVTPHFPAAARMPMPAFHDRYYKEDGKMEDHHAIIPTGNIPSRHNPDGSVSDSYVLWELITKRFLTSILPPAKVLACSRVLTFEHPEKKEISFRAILKAAPLADPGWMVLENILGNTRGYGKNLAERKAVKFPESPPSTRCSRVEKVKNYTERPPEFNDDTLLGAMQKLSLGTAATRADVMEKLIAQQYIERRPSGFLSPKAAGTYLVVQLRKLDGQDILSPDLTTRWEKVFEEIETGERVLGDRVAFLADVVKNVKSIGEKLSHVIGATAADVVCPLTYEKVTEDEYQFYFRGYKDVIFKKSYLGRKMSSADWRNILIANPKTGYGPLVGLKSAKGPMDASVGFLEKPTKYGHFKLIFSKKRAA